MRERPIGPEKDLIEQGLEIATSRRGLLKLGGAAGLALVGVGLDRLLRSFGSGRAEAQAVDPEFDKREIAEKLFIPGNRIFNSDFELARRMFNRQTRQWEIVGPVGWEAIGDAHYNYGDNSGYYSRSSVSTDLIARSDPFIGCTFERGIWQYSRRVPINPRMTYELAYAAKHKTLLSGNVLHSSEVAIFDTLDPKAEPIFTIQPNPSSPVEDYYVSHKAVTVGSNGELPWPEEARFVGIKLFAGGFGPSCPDGAKVAEVWYDNVYFGPVRT